TDNQVAWELGANYVLDGTVRRSGNRVRITAELVHIGGRNHVWANSYDGELGDVLNLQSRLAQAIAADIRLSLTPSEQAQFAKVPTLNGEGYEAYLRGRSSMNGGGADGTRGKIANLEKSIALNPGYAPGYVGLAVMYRRQASYGWQASREAYPKM